MSLTISRKRQSFFPSATEEPKKVANTAQKVIGTPIVSTASKKSKFTVVDQTDVDNSEAVGCAVQKTLQLSASSIGRNISSQLRPVTPLILGYLNPATLHSCSEWEELAPFITDSSWDIKTFFPHVTIFQTGDWLETVLPHVRGWQVEVLPLDKRMICLALEEYYSLLEKKDEKVTVLAMPKNLDPNILLHFSTTLGPQSRQSISCGVWTYILNKAQEPIETTYHLIVSSASRSHQSPANTIVKSEECRRATVLEMIAFDLISLHNQSFDPSVKVNEVVGSCRAFENIMNEHLVWQFP